MRTIIPFDATNPKSRLSPVLSPVERAAFANAMLGDVLEAIETTVLEPTVVTTAPLEVTLPVPVRVDDRPLDPLVNDVIEEGTPVAVLMADLPLLTPDAIRRLLDTEGDVVLGPGRGAGTNAMVVRDEAFSVDFHGASIRDHREIARQRDLSVGTVDSFRLSTDVDEPGDLLEVLVHGEDRAASWLESAGFEIQIEDGRPAAIRD